MWGRVLFESKQISFAEGEALCLAVAVYTEYKIKLQDAKTRYRYEFCRSSIPYGADDRNLTERFNPEDADHDSCMVEWSPEREAFFASLVIALEGLIIKLHELTQDKKKLLLFADRGARESLSRPNYK